MLEKVSGRQLRSCHSGMKSNNGSPEANYRDIYLHTLVNGNRVHPSGVFIWGDAVERFFHLIASHRSVSTLVGLQINMHLHTRPPHHPGWPKNMHQSEVSGLTSCSKGTNVSPVSLVLDALRLIISSRDRKARLKIVTSIIWFDFGVARGWGSGGGVRGP